MTSFIAAGGSGPLHQLHASRSRSLIRHHNRLHDVKPAFLEQAEPLRSTTLTGNDSLEDRLLRKPTIGRVGCCCARAASGNVATLPSVMMNSRRRIRIAM
jgi:hypothetical protein